MIWCLEIWISLWHYRSLYSQLWLGVWIVSGFTIQSDYVNDPIQFDITMHHNYIKFILCIFIKLYKQATFKNNYGN